MHRGRQLGVGRRLREDKLDQEEAGDALGAGRSRSQEGNSKGRGLASGPSLVRTAFLELPRFAGWPDFVAGGQLSAISLRLFSIDSRWRESQGKRLAENAFHALR